MQGTGADRSLERCPDCGVQLPIQRGLAHDFARRIIGALTEEAGTLVWLAYRPKFV